jgi:hypothetical protein
MFLQKVTRRTTYLKNSFCWGLEVKNENSRIRIHWSEAWILGSGSGPKCHGSTTLAPRKANQQRNFDSRNFYNCYETFCEKKKISFANS